MKSMKNTQNMYKSKHYFLYLTGSLLLSMISNANADSVLVGHPITVGISELLLKNSEIKIIQAVPKKLPASRQQHYLETRGKEPLVELSQKADAVITVKSISAKDYLYPLARRNNINIIPIDIAQPIDGSKSGVAKLSLAIDGEHPVWLNPNSLLTMMAIFSDEVKRLKTTNSNAAQIIDKNLQQQQHKLRQMANQMEKTLDTLNDDPVALVLSPKLSYFVQGLQMQYHLADTENLNDETLNKIIEENDITLVISIKKIAKERQKILTKKGVKTLRIKRLKSENPVEQLGKYYTDLEKILQD